MPNMLTARTVESQKPDPAGRLEMRDGIVPGLYLIVQPSGTKSWALRFRWAGKPAKHTLGAAGVLSLVRARTAARGALEGLAKGIDPRAGKRAAAGAAASLPGTVNDLADRYVDQRLKKQVRRWQAAEGEINNHLRPHLGGLRLDEISRGHVRQMLAAIEPSAPVAANRALQRCRALFRWATENDLAPADPTLGIKRPTKERPVDRTLADDELVAVWRATEKLTYPAQQFARLLILSGQRRDDVRAMSWGEIDLDRGDWLIPAARYKGDRPHLIPLTATMVEMLHAMPFKERGGFVLSPSAGKKPYGNVTKPKAAIDKASGVIGWTWHDIRRTLRTGLSRLGVRPDIAERVIGHAVGGRLGQTYDTHEFRAEKRTALEAWGTHLRACLDGRDGAGNVVELRRVQP